MSLSLDKVLEINEEEFQITLFERDYISPEAKKQMKMLTKKTIQELEECHQEYLEIFSKLEILQVRSENLFTIIQDSE